MPRSPAAAIIARVRWPLRHPFKTILLLAWAGLYGLAWAVQFGRFGVLGEPFGSFERREISTTAAPNPRPVAHEDVAKLARKQDGARVDCRSASVAKYGGVLRLVASAHRYAIDGPLTRSNYFSNGLLRYEADHAGPKIESMELLDEAGRRLQERFPMDGLPSLDDFDETAIVPTPFRPRLSYTFTRTADALSQGWDLDVRLPFWLIYLALASPLLPIALTRVTRRLRRRRRRSRGRCEQCGYDRRGLTSARCPECGHRAM